MTPSKSKMALIQTMHTSLRGAHVQAIGSACRPYTPATEPDAKGYLDLVRPHAKA